MSITLGSSTITGLSAGGLPDGSVNAADLSSTAIVDKLGYTPLDGTTTLPTIFGTGGVNNGTSYTSANNCVPPSAMMAVYLTSGDSGAPNPPGGDGCIMAFTYGGPYASQIYVDIDPTNLFGVRTKGSGNTWTSWRSI